VIPQPERPRTASDTHQCGVRVSVVGGPRLADALVADNVCAPHARLIASPEVSVGRYEPLRLRLGEVPRAACRRGCRRSERSPVERVQGVLRRLDPPRPLDRRLAKFRRKVFISRPTLKRHS